MENLKLSRELLKDYNLSSKHLFKKKAGNAKYYYQLQFDNSLKNDLNELSKLYNSNNPFKIFGSHTNIYITHNGYDGLFVDISSKKSKIIFNEENEEFSVSANTLTSELVNYTMNLGYDFASLTGVPGMVGAGIVGNSSWATGKDFGEYVKKLVLFDFKECKEVEVIPDDSYFSIRNSYIKKENREKTRFFVKEAILKSEFIGKEKVREKYLDQIDKRKDDLKTAYLEGCAGSLWANPHLRDNLGMSFRKIITIHTEFNVNFNGARYSNIGGKFFITDENTTDADVAKLFDFTIKKLKELYNIEPHKEVLILDYDGEIDVYEFLKRYL